MNLILAGGTIILAILAQIFLQLKQSLFAVVLFIIALIWSWLSLKGESIFPKISGSDAPPTSGFSRQTIRLGFVSILSLAISLFLFESDNPTITAWGFYLFAIILIFLAMQNASFSSPWSQIKSRSWNWGEGLLLVLILLLAYSVRVYLLHFYPFGTWYDEADYGIRAREILENATSVLPIYIRGGYDAPAHFLYLIVLAFKFLGASTYSLRLVSVFFGVATVAVGYLAGREFIDSRFGLLVAFLLAVSRWDINFSRLGMHCVTTPFFALLTIGLLLRALRTGRLRDYCGSGLALGLGICFYTAFRLFPFVIAIFLIIYILLNPGFLKNQWRGLVVFFLGSLIAAGPVLEFAVVHPNIFWERTDEVSIFENTNPEDLPRILMESTSKHLLMFNYKGDGNGRHNLPGTPMLDTVSGALFILGLGGCLARLKNPKASLLIYWTIIMLAPGIFSLDFEAPQSLRSIGTLPAVLIIAGVGLYSVQVFLENHLPVFWGKLFWIPATILLAQIGSANLDMYFNKQITSSGSWGAFSTSESLAAQIIKTYGNDYDYYLSVFYCNTPTIEFLVPEIHHFHVIGTSDLFPVQMNTDKGAIFLLDPERKAQEDELKKLYPEAEFTEYKSPDGLKTYLIAAVISVDQVNQIQGSEVQYTAASAEDTDFPLTQKDAVIQTDWSDGSPLAFPFTADWSGVLYAPEYGVYTLILETPSTAQVTIDDQQIMDGQGTQQVDIELAHGSHSLQIHAEGAAGHVELRWIPPDGTEEVVPTWALFSSPVTNNGLLGEFYPNGDWTPPAELKEITPQFNLYIHVIPFDRPYTVKWSGYIMISTARTYTFSLVSTDESTLIIDDIPVIENPSGHDTSGMVELTTGFHTIEIRFADRTNNTGISFYWINSDGQKELVPSDVLLLPTTDLDKVIIPTDLSDQEETQNSQLLDTFTTVDTRVNWQIGSTDGELDQFNNPQGISLDSQGNLYVADTGNHRVVKISPEGEILSIIGSENGLLDEPVATAITSTGELIVMDASKEDWLLRFDSQGNFIGTIETSVTPYHPRGMSIDADDNLLVADTGTLRILNISLDGTLLNQWGGGNSNLCEGQPVSVLSTPDGNLYWLEATNGQFNRLNAGESFETLATLNIFSTVTAPQLTLGQDGNIYFADPDNSLIYAFNDNGRLIYGMNASFLQQPTGLAAGNDGTLYIADARLNLITSLTPEK